MDTLGSLLFGIGALVYGFAFLTMIMLSVAMPLMAFFALRHLKGVRLALERLAEDNERRSVVVGDSQPYVRTGPLSIR